MKPFTSAAPRPPPSSVTPPTRKRSGTSSTQKEDPLLQKVESLHELISDRCKTTGGQPAQPDVDPDTELWAKLMARELSTIPRLARLRFRNAVSNQLFELMAQHSEKE